MLRRINAKKLEIPLWWRIMSEDDHQVDAIIYTEMVCHRPWYWRGRRHARQCWHHWLAEDPAAILATRQWHPWNSFGVSFGWLWWSPHRARCAHPLASLLVKSFVARSISAATHPKKMSCFLSVWWSDSWKHYCPQACCPLHWLLDLRPNPAESAVVSCLPEDPLLLAASLAPEAVALELSVSVLSRSRLRLPLWMPCLPVATFKQCHPFSSSTSFLAD